MPPRAPRTLPAALGLALSLALAATGRAADPEYPAADGSTVVLRPPHGGATALVFYSVECPISNYYSATLNAIRADYPAERLRIVGICVDPDLTPEAQAAHAREYELKFPAIRDPEGRLAAAFGASKTPEAVVVDGTHRVRYRGRIDDQYAERRVKTANPQTHELRDALDAVLAGREVERPEVAAVGCPLPEPPGRRGGPAVTYSRDVAPILNRHCVACHRPGQIGPFALGSYEQASKRAADLLDVVESRQMPPWKPAPGFGPEFAHDRTMGPEEVATLAAWVEADAPEGDPAELPEPPALPDGWALGEPDLVIEIPEDFRVPAAGDDIYRCFVIPTDLPEDMYVAGLEYRPGNPRVVHHMLGYVDVSGEARKKDAAEPGAGYTCFGGPQIEVNYDLGGWAPGAEASFLPEGMGRSFPKGCDVVLQVHYHPSGKVETDRSRIGLYFAKKPVKRAFHWWATGSMNFRLEPEKPETWTLGARGELAWPMPVDVELVALSPHMHLLGKSMEMWAEVPKGEGAPPERIDLIRIDDWDFQWQNQYYLKEPVRLPAGTLLKVKAAYDYSRENPRNPHRDADPMPVVTFGEATTDEMCLGFFGVVKADQDLTQPGQRDDLNEIFVHQRRELQKRQEEARRRRAAGDAD